MDLLTDPIGGGTWDLGPLSFPATLAWYVAVMNAINLVDGLDGLATGLSAISAMVMFLIGLTTGNVGFILHHALKTIAGELAKTGVAP